MEHRLPLNKMVVGDILRLNALRFPNKIALIEHETDEQLTWAQLDDRVDRLAQGLATELGVQKGDRVFVIMHDGLRYYELNFALCKLGAIHVPINTMLSPEEQIYIINDAEPVVGIIQNEWVEYFR